ncbi:MAG: hypothetical protein ACOYLQ_15745 [Hyphomicrobiaceae bacterium]|jgi:hypothetical protein
MNLAQPSRPVGSSGGTRPRVLGALLGCVLGWSGAAVAASAGEKIPFVHGRLVSPVAAGPARTPSPPCLSPRISFRPVGLGLTEIAVRSDCRAGQDMIIDYAGASFIQNLDDTGRATFVLDCFAGYGELISIRFIDRTEVMRLPPEQTARLTKVAILWSSGVDLDLHALEFGATFGDARHVWAGKSPPSERTQNAPGADRRGRGLVTTSSRGQNLGTSAEVYTYEHGPDEPAGSIRFAVDFVSRGDRASGDFCGDAPRAGVHMRIVVLQPDGAVRQSTAEFAPLACGTELAGPARYNTKLIPELRVRRP